MTEQKKLNKMLWQPIFFLFPPIFFQRFPPKKEIQSWREFSEGDKDYSLFFIEIQKSELDSPKKNVGSAKTGCSCFFLFHFFPS